MRGEVGAGLTPGLAIDFASAFGTYTDGGKIIVGADTRFSSPMLTHAVCSALMSCGCEVISAGITSAPLMHFMVPHLEADGAILIGAGHHPAGWNALMPLAANGAYFNSVQMQQLLDIYHSHKYRNSDWKSIGKIVEIPRGVDDAYLEMICSRLDIEAIRSMYFTVLADFCNGSGSCLAENFASRLGIELIPINNSFTGILPHDPEPRPRSSVQVKSIMRVLNAEAGFVFNSDASRMAVVTSSAETLSEEYTFPLVADQVLEKSEAGTGVVTNWCTTRTLDEIVESHKGNLFKTKVGQSPIIDRMIELNAGLGGEGSGSIALGDSVKGFDGFMAMGLVLEALATRKCSSAELAERLPRYHIIKKKINCPSAHAYSLLKGLQDKFSDAKFSEEDGLRFDWPDGWIHFRTSVTEPVIRMIVEWKTLEEANYRADQMRGMLERLVWS
jgi:phosphomannomutase